MSQRPQPIVTSSSAASHSKRDIYVNQVYDLLYRDACWDKTNIPPRLEHKINKHAGDRILLYRCLEAKSDVVIERTKLLRSDDANTSQTCTRRLQQIAQGLGQGAQAETRHGKTATADAALAAQIAASIYMTLGEHDRALHLLAPVEGEEVQGWERISGVTDQMPLIDFLEKRLFLAITLQEVDQHERATKVTTDVVELAAKALESPHSCTALQRAATDILVQACVLCRVPVDVLSQDMKQHWASINVLPPTRPTHSYPADLQHFLTCLHACNILANQLLHRRKRDLPPHVAWWTRGGTLAFWHAFHGLFSFVLRWANDDKTPGRDTAADQRLPTAHRTPPRTQLQRLELAQECYENELTKPENGEIDEKIKVKFLECAASNWQLICSSSGCLQRTRSETRVNLGRALVQLLKRMQNHTYHCVQILRHLFTLHVYFTEFDEAISIFDAYVNILVKEKSSQQKGFDGPELDSDSTALSLATSATRMLCQYGSSSHTLCALTIGQMLEQWLQDDAPLVARERHAVDPPTDGPPAGWARSSKTYSRTAATAAINAVGLSYATFAKTTNDARLRREAFEHARRVGELALADETSASSSLESCYVLTVVSLATAQFEDAYAYARSGLTNNTPFLARYSHEEHVSVAADASSIETQNPFHLLPLYHLDFLIACLDQQCCTSDDAALEFPTRFHALVFPPKDDSTSPPRPFEELGNHEKLNIIEAFRTFVVYTGVTKGVHAAVERCSELIFLYTQLFGSLKQEQNHSGQLVPPPTEQPPKSSRGTIRSFVSRSKRNRLSQEGDRRIPLEPIPHNFPHDKPPPPVSHEKQPPEQDMRLPIDEKLTAPASESTAADPPKLQPPNPTDADPSLPATSTAKHILQPPAAIFPEPATLRYRHAALITIWLFISSIYSAAADHAEAATAVSNARSSFDALETDLAARTDRRESTGDVAYKGWGPVRTHAQLLADIFAAEGDALCAQVWAPALRRKFLPVRGARPVDVAADVDKNKVLTSARSRYREAVLRCSAHHDGTVGLARILLESPDSSPRHEAYGLLRDLTAGSEGYSSVSAWKLLGVAAGAIGRDAEAVAALTEAQRWMDVTSLRPWSVVNAGGCVLGGSSAFVGGLVGRW